MEHYAKDLSRFCEILLKISLSGGHGQSPLDYTTGQDGCNTKNIERVNHLGKTAARRRVCGMSISSGRPEVSHGISVLNLRGNGALSSRTLLLGDKKGMPHVKTMPFIPKSYLSEKVEKENNVGGN